MYCSSEEPKQETEQETEDSSTTQIPLSTMSGQNNYAAQPDIVYATIVKSPPARESDDPYANDISALAHNNDGDASGEIIYSELHRTRSDAHVVAPSGDVYAQVKKRPFSQ